MKKIKKFLEWLKTKKVIASFAVISLIGGFLFITPKITGNVISNNKYSLNPISLIGLLLILCSVILAIHTLKKK